MTDKPLSAGAPWWHQIGALLGVALVYFVLARLSLLLAFEGSNASPVWPPSGLAFAAVVLLGWRVWPSIAAGAFVANLVFLMETSEAPWGSVIVVSMLTGGGNAAEAIVGGLLYKRLGLSASLFSRAQDGFRFVLVACGMCLISAMVGPVALIAFGLLPEALFFSVQFTWWLGDVTGVLIVSPVLLCWAGVGSEGWSGGRPLELLSLFVGLILMCGLLFGGWLDVSQVGSLAYLLLPFVLWAAFRFDARVWTLLALLATGLTILGTIHGQGPFSSGSLNQQLLLVQTFLSSMSIVTIILGATVAERRRAQESLERVAVNLREMNKELEQFAYVVSHDLKAPLRAIHQLSGWLSEDYRDKIDEEGQRRFDLLLGRVMRMDGLIEGILQYSRAGRQAMVLSEVNARDVVEEFLKAREKKEGFEVKIEGELPVLTCDRIQLQQILQNLIDNALKHHGKASGQVVVSSQDAGECWRFTVEDDGIGIDEKHTERIFEMFQTLNPRDKLETTGVGLTIVKRLVERTGGQVEVKSKLGVGSRFMFTIPKTIKVTQYEEEGR